MIERRHGYIVNTGSMAGLVPLTGEGAPYIASKFAVVGLTEALALYARPFGIGVSLLCPGGVATNLAETGRSIGMTPEREVSETRMAQSVQGGQEMQPEEIGELVVDRADPASGAGRQHVPGRALRLRKRDRLPHSAPTALASSISEGARGEWRIGFLRAR
jgi:NAD(P)-dependent dehydrogenase (short-subunit alcohol dehydrogenase family)